MRERARKFSMVPKPIGSQTRHIGIPTPNCKSLKKFNKTDPTTSHPEPSHLVPVLVVVAGLQVRDDNLLGKKGTT